MAATAPIVVAAAFAAAVQGASPVGQTTAAAEAATNANLPELTAAFAGRMAQAAVVAVGAVAIAAAAAAGGAAGDAAGDAAGVSPFRWCGSFGDGADVGDAHPLGDPRGMGVHEGHVFIADGKYHEIAMYTCGGTFVRTVGSRGEAPGQFEVPRAVHVVGGRWLVVVDCAARVQVLTLEGEPRQVLELDGYREDGVMLNGLHASPDGKHVHVADTDGSRVFVFEVAG